MDAVFVTWRESSWTVVLHMDGGGKAPALPNAIHLFLDSR